MVKLATLSISAFLALAIQAQAQAPIAAPDAAPPAVQTGPTTDATVAPKTDASPEKVAKADQPVCHYEHIDNSMIRKRVCR